MIRSRALAFAFTALITTAWGGAAAAQEPQPLLWTNTERVNDLSVSGTELLAATNGGLERYDLATGERTRLYTTLDGLDVNRVNSLTSDESGMLRVRTERSDCSLAVDDRFVCAASPRAYVPRIAPAAILRGSRVTAEAVHGGVRYVGTSGGGVFRIVDRGEPERLTPEGQICSNHITDVVAHGDRLFFGSFAEGLSVRDASDPGATFRDVSTPFRMINDIESTPRGLFVAANGGLFRSRDGGVTFERFYERVVGRAATGLAFDGQSLWVTTPGSLQRVHLMRGAPRSRGWWRPAASTAVQDVALATDGQPGVWIVTEDRGALRFVPGDTHDDPRVRLFDRAAGLPTSWAYTVDTTADGTAWVGTLRHGLVAIAADGSHRQMPLPDQWLLRVRRDPGGALFVGTQGGAFIVRPEGAEPEPVANVPDPRVHEMVAIDGTLYIGTEGGTLAVPFQS